MSKVSEINKRLKDIERRLSTFVVSEIELEDLMLEEDELKYQLSLLEKGKGKGRMSDWPSLDDGMLDTGADYKPYMSHKYVKCAFTHPKLQIGPYTITGGSCSEPKNGPYDIEIGFCGTMRFPHDVFPWSPTQYVRLTIQDQHTPTNKDDFDKLIDWTIEMLKAGKKIHCGCIGGHGRTGLFLSVLVHKITGEADSTTMVRNNYCKKAVESQKQVNWLYDNYGITKVAPRHAARGSIPSAQTRHEKKTVSKMKFGTNKTDKAVKRIMPLEGYSVFGNVKLIDPV